MCSWVWQFGIILAMLPVSSVWMTTARCAILCEGKCFTGAVDFISENNIASECSQSLKFSILPFFKLQKAIVLNSHVETNKLIC